MNKILMCLLLLALSTKCLAQTQDRVLYIVDSIPVIDEPKEDEQPRNDEIAFVKVVTNPDSIKQAGYDGKLDKIIYVTTKAYTQRTAAVKLIPTTKTMVRKNGLWH